MKDIETLIREGEVAQALEFSYADVRANPSKPEPRRLLFDLLCVTGQWEKARTQLRVYGELSSNDKFLRVFGELLQCELLREAIFQGKKTPLIMGEPEEWLSCLIKANELIGAKAYDAARDLRAQAFEGAAPVPGKVNGVPFEWLGDADARLGPVLEVIINGSYKWLPIHQVASLTMGPPEELPDLVWAQANFTWTNGGNSVGYIPVRYVGTTESKDGEMLLARKTDWRHIADDIEFGVGQRELSTDGADYALLDVRSLEFTQEE